jgi:hypothetical protein
MIDEQYQIYFRQWAIDNIIFVRGRTVLGINSHLWMIYDVVDTNFFRQTPESVEGLLHGDKC